MKIHVNNSWSKVHFHSLIYDAIILRSSCVLGVDRGERGEGVDSIFNERVVGVASDRG